MTIRAPAWLLVLSALLGTASASEPAEVELRLSGRFLIVDRLSDEEERRWDVRATSDAAGVLQRWRPPPDALWCIDLPRNPAPADLRAVALLARSVQVPGLRLHELGPAARAELRRLLRALPGLQVLSISRADLSLADLDAIATLGSLQVLDLPRLDDEGALRLEKLGALRELNVGARGLAHVAASLPVGLRELRLHEARDLDLDEVGTLSARLPDLEVLRLDRATLDDGALATIAALPRLRRLDLSWCHAPTRGLARLAQIRSLRELVLDGTVASDDTLVALAQLPALTELHLGCCRRVTDRGAAVLGIMRSLRRLDLSGTSITTDGSRRLQRLGDLQRLQPPAIGPEAVWKLRVALPRCDVGP